MRSRLISGSASSLELLQLVTNKRSRIKDLYRIYFRLEASVVAKNTTEIFMMLGYTCLECASVMFG